jgi:hypothetical protein
MSANPADKPGSEPPPKTEMPAVTAPDKPGDQSISEAIADRAKQYGIEIREDAAKVFAEGEPTELDKYGDPVNLKYPLSNTEEAVKARASFKGELDKYREERSKTIVHDRIVEALFAFGAEVTFEADDPGDSLLSQALKDKLAESNTKALDSFRKRLENVKNRLLALES